MQIDLSQLESDGLRVEEAFPAEALAVESKRKRAAGVRPVSATLRAWIRPEGPLVRATGEIEAEGRAECDRCLKPVTVPMSGTFDQRYSWTNPEPVRVRGVRDEEVSLEEEEMDIAPLDGTVLDTADLAREQVVLATPIRVVCTEDCAGLCPNCGKDLNAGDCGCEQETGDPRWEALKQLKTKESGSDDPETR